MRIELDHAQRPETVFGISVEGEAVGVIGFLLGADVHRLTAEIGYWLGEGLWGRGIMADAVRAVTRHAIDTHGLSRLAALPFAWNVASARVLEKAGYVHEGVHSRSAIKDGRIIDQVVYAFVVDNDLPGT